MATYDKSKPAIECIGLTKDYGGGHGLFGLDLTVQPGEVFGLIGPNGAGKTTMIRLLMDLIRPTSGSAKLFGLDARGDSREIKKHVGYLTGELPQFPGVTVDYVISLLAGLRGGISRQLIEALVDRLELELDRRYEDLSHGNKQKVGIVQAFMHQPDLLILDEPTLGLDPVMQREFRNLVTEAVANGATVLLSSHVLPEVQQVCSRIGLINLGRLHKVGTLDELREARAHRVTAVFNAGVTGLLPDGVAGVSDVNWTAGVLTCAVHGDVGPLVRWLAQFEIKELDISEISLEEVFLHEIST